MFKASTLLKVVSILAIIGGSFGLIGTIATPFLSNMAEEMSGVSMDDMGLGITTISLVLGGVFSLLYIFIGILGLCGKSYKLSWILIIIYTVYAMYNIFVAISMIGFSVLSCTSLIIPALYMWGLCISKPREVEAQEVQE